MSKAMRFYGKLHRKPNNQIVVETQEGDYEFDASHLVDHKPHNRLLEEILVSESAPIVLRTTVAKIAEARESAKKPQSAGTPSAMNVQGGIIGGWSHEWRG